MHGEWEVISRSCMESYQRNVASIPTSKGVYKVTITSKLSQDHAWKVGSYLKIVHEELSKKCRQRTHKQGSL